MAARCHVLEVDDDEDIRVIVALALGLDGDMAVSSVAAGHEALERLREWRWPVDLLLLDYRLADMEGMQLLQQVRAIPSCSGLPVVFLTGLADPITHASPRDAGATAVLLKPFDPLLLAASLRTILDKSRAS